MKGDSGDGNSKTDSQVDLVNNGRLFVSINNQLFFFYLNRLIGEKIVVHKHRITSTVLPQHTLSITSHFDQSNYRTIECQILILILKC